MKPITIETYESLERIMDRFNSDLYVYIETPNRVSVRVEISLRGAENMFAVARNNGFDLEATVHPLHNAEIGCTACKFITLDIVPKTPTRSSEEEKSVGAALIEAFQNQGGELIDGVIPDKLPEDEPEFSLLSIIYHQYHAWLESAVSAGVSERRQRLGRS